ncbi:hypothetical protein SB00094_01133 [Klebsiella variicola subsp. tropica]|nr:hypothetical protein SB00094_01133 [Klebsiella variicola subsp. tropica]
MAVADDVQLAAVFQAATGVVKHLPGNMIGNRVLLMERRIAQNRRKAIRLNAGERVVDHKFAALDIIRQVVLDVQTAGSHRHMRLIGKHHTGVRVLRQRLQANHSVAAAEIGDLAFQIGRQMFEEEARADIQAAAGKNVGMVMDGPRRAVQLPAVGLRRIGKLRRGENAVDQTRFFPRQRGGGGAKDFLK